MIKSLYKSNTFKIPQQRINDYAQVSGGGAKIHTDPEYASQTVFKGTLVHGLFLVTLIESKLAEIYPEWKGMVDVSFKRPIKANQPFHIQFDKENEHELIIKIVTEQDEVAVSGIAQID